MLHTPLSVAASFLPLINGPVHADCALIMVSVILVLLLLATTCQYITCIINSVLPCIFVQGHTATTYHLLFYKQLIMKCIHTSQYSGTGMLQYSIVGIYANNISFNLYGLGAYVCDYFSATPLCQEYLLPFNPLPPSIPCQGHRNWLGRPCNCQNKVPVQLQLHNIINSNVQEALF